MILIRDKKDMISLINMCTSGAQVYGYEMVVIPLLLADTLPEANALLLEVERFDPRVDGDILPAGAVGTVRMCKTRTVYDALKELECVTLSDPRLLGAAVECMVDEHIRGKTYKVTIIPFGECIIDVRKFADVTGLPSDSDDIIEYSVFLREVTDKSDGDGKIVLVLVKGTTDVSRGNGGKRTALQPMLSRLESRAKTGFEPSASFHARDLDNGWQLYNNALFPDLLGWWKSGFHYWVESNENQGLNISY